MDTARGESDFEHDARDNCSVASEVRSVVDGMLTLIEDQESGCIPPLPKLDAAVSTDTLETRETASETVSPLKQEVSTYVAVSTSDVATSPQPSISSETSTNTQHYTVLDQAMATEDLETKDIGTSTCTTYADSSTSPRKVDLTVVFTTSSKKEEDKENNPKTLVQSLRSAPNLRLGLSRHVSKPLRVQRQNW